MRAICMRYNLQTTLCEWYVRGQRCQDKRAHARDKIHNIMTEFANGTKELLALTDAHVEQTLRNQDAAQGKWLGEDPTLAQIQHALMSR